MNAQTNDEARQLLLAIKRVIDEDLIDKPVQASEILGLQISDYFGPNEEVRPTPVIGKTKPREIHKNLVASIVASDNKQRINYGLVQFTVMNFRSIVDDRTKVSHELITDIFGSQFILASSKIRPMWRPDTDFSSWSGQYPNESFLYQLPKPGQMQMSIKLDSNSFLSGITLFMKRRNGDNK